MMNFRVNLNGNEPDDILQMARRIDEACGELDRALRAAWPHGRNYQTVDDPPEALSADVDTFRHAVEQVQYIREIVGSTRRIVFDHGRNR